MKKTQKTENVYLFAPNVIGYLRVLLLVASCFTMSTKPGLTALLYLVSCGLDAVDGYAARYFNQVSKFGAVLDMVTDRSSTVCLMCFLILKYPSYVGMFQFLIALDLSSHYMQMFSTLSSGLDSHKKVDQTQNPLLRLYYTNRFVLFSLCAFNEFYWILLYYITYTTQSQYRVNVFGTEVGFFTVLSYVCLPFCALKHIMNMIQLVQASHNLVSLDIKDRLAADEKKK
jgi:CDP-diacylglycerol--inositol 3-phosphatidyltransferase